MTILRRVPVGDALWQKLLHAPVHEGPLPEVEHDDLAEAMRAPVVRGEIMTAEICCRAATELTTPRGE